MKNRTKRKIKKSSRLALSIFLYSFVFVASIASLMYIFFFAGLFYVYNIEIVSSDNISLNEVQATVTLALNKKKIGIPAKFNTYYVDLDEIEIRIKEKFPKIDKVVINRISRNGISVKLIERVPIGIWCAKIQEQCFYFDDKGVAYLEIPESSGFLFPNIYDFRNNKVHIGSKISGDLWIDNILSAQRAMKFGGIGALEFSIASNSFDEFNVKTSEGWDIYLNLDTEIHRQISSMITFLRESITQEERDDLEYVDLRIQDRIYYK